MKNLLFTLILCLFTINLSAQDIESQLNFAINPCDSIGLVQPTSDGGYIFSISNYSSTNGGLDYSIVKTTATGSTQWQQNYGGSSSDYLSAILETSDGGYILGGTSYSSDGDVGGNYGSGDYWIVKINASGIMQWEQNFGGLYYEELTNMIATNDGGYLLAGTSASSNGNVGGNNGSLDYWIVKTNSFGTLQWEKNFGGSSYDDLKSVAQTSDGGYILGGYSNSSNGNVGGNNGSYDYWIVKTNSFGTLQWEKNYGGSDYERFANLAETSDGGFILGGTSNSSNGNVGGNFGGNDYWIVKTNSFGTLQWEKNYGTSGYETLLSVEEMSDGGFLLVGSYYDDEVIKTNAFGTLQWSQTYNNNNYYHTLSGTETNDGGILLIEYNGNCGVAITNINDGSVICPSDVRLEAEAGDVYVDESCYGLILTAPDGSCFRVRVKSDATLTIDPVVCP